VLGGVKFTKKPYIDVYPTSILTTRSPRSTK
jgi:hypothetical protein